MHIYESDTDVIRSTFLNMYVFKSLINAVAYYYFALDIIILIPLRYIAHVRSVQIHVQCRYKQALGSDTGMVTPAL